MSRDLDRELERLRAATDPIAPDDGLTDAILGAATKAGARDPLAEIAKATASIEAPDALVDAVLAHVAHVARVAKAEKSAHVIPIDAARRAAPARAPSWMDGVTRSGPIAVGLAIVAAAASFLFFVTSQGDVDATVVSSVDTVEVLE